MTYDDNRYDTDDRRYDTDDYRYDTPGAYNESDDQHTAYYDPRDRRQWALVRGLRALSGTIAAGIVVLTIVVIASAYLGGSRGFPGPGAASITAHIVASVVAVTAQIVCDRRRGIIAVAASVFVFVAAGALLVTQWWG